jgi:heme exporter protein C
MIKLTPNFFNKYGDIFRIISGVIALVLMIMGLYIGLVISPADYQQGEMVRVMYVHVPSAWMALGIYSFMAFCSFIYIVWRNQIFDLIAKKAAPIGAIFAFITLVTGSIWGKPIWGTWWVWDARLTSMLILFFFYIGHILLTKALENEIGINDGPAILSIMGFINVPIVKFSVEYWASLHQKASVFRLGGPTIHPQMLLPLMIMFGGCIMLFIFLLIMNVQTELMKRKLLRSKNFLATKQVKNPGYKK